MFNLTGWELVCPFGYAGLIFAKGNWRALFNKRTGDLLLLYTIK